MGAMLLWCDSSIAAPTWSSPDVVATTTVGSIYGGSVAMDAVGNAVVGWQRAGLPALVQVASRRAGSTGWSEPTTLTDAGGVPYVALDSAGDAFALFHKDYIQTSVRDGATGDWQTPITISGPGLFGGAALRFDAAGDTFVAWKLFAGGDIPVQAAVRSASGRWQAPPTTLSTSAWRGPALDVDRPGNAIVIWSQRGGGDSEVMQASLRSATTGEWENPVNISDAITGRFTDFWDPEVAFDAAGNATAVWAVAHLDHRSADIYAAVRTAGGPWGPPNRIATAGDRADLSLAVTPGGTAIVVWRTESATRSVVYSVSRAPAQPWGSPVALSMSGRYALGLSLASNSSGNAVVAWLERSTEFAGPTTLRAALRPAATGYWESASSLATANTTTVYAANVALDGSGHAIVTWTPGDSSIEAVDLDGSGPLLDAPAIPQTGATGVLVHFGVSPAAWSAPLVGAVRWDFGDGSSARGPRPSHVYREARTYTVTVSQDDASGAQSSLSETITIVKPTLVNARRPVIRGTPRVGGTLRCDRGSWSGTKPIFYATRWLRNGSLISRGERYRIRSVDAGALLACRVKATNGPKTAVAFSRSVRVR
jgi:hypothetical protein